MKKYHEIRLTRCRNNPSLRLTLNSNHYQMTPAHLAILATVATIGNMAIAKTLGHHPALGIAWTIGQSMAIATLYTITVILTA